MKIHPLAIVSPDAQLGHDIEIGPFSIVEPDTELGDGCRLEGRVTIKRGTRLGPHNHVYEGAVLGGLPQHVHKPSDVGALIVGSHNTFRENVTLHRALRPGTATCIGDHNYLMANAHVAHDCTVGNHIIMANNVLLAGHVLVEDRAFISGAVAIHQFCRVGCLAMVGGQAHVTQDVLPFTTIDGATSLTVGLNLIGLRRNGYSTSQVAELKAAYRLIYRGGHSRVETLGRLAQQFASGPAALMEPFLATCKRGFVAERRGPAPVTLKLVEANQSSGHDHARRRLAG